METAASTDRKQGIRNRPPSHDRFRDHYDNSVKLELEYTYMPLNTQGISRHLLIARSTNFNGYLTIVAKWLFASITNLLFRI